MRIAAIDGRSALLTPLGYVDVAIASNGRFAADPQELFPRWQQFREWAADVTEGPILDPGSGGLWVPVPRPPQIFAIGLNYASHAAETGSTVPEHPPTFTKFQSCLTGPSSTVSLPSDTVDWEVELVVAIGRCAEAVSPEAAWAHVAGLTVGQDLSERTVQFVGPVPQFSLAKSYPGFGPLGPELVTPDELADPDNLELGCSINGETVQKGRTSSMVFTVPELIARLSAVCPLYPGDLIFTGTPEGVGMGRKPPRYLQPGDVLSTWVEGVGEFDTTFVAGADHPSRRFRDQQRVSVGK